MLEGGVVTPPPTPWGMAVSAPTASVRTPLPSSRFATASTATEAALQPLVPALETALDPSLSLHPPPVQPGPPELANSPTHRDVHCKVMCMSSQNVAPMSDQSPQLIVNTRVIPRVIHETALQRILEILKWTAFVASCITMRQASQSQEPLAKGGALRRDIPRVWYVWFAWG